MTGKTDATGGEAPIPTVEAPAPTTSGIFDFGAPAGARKRLFQFAKPGLSKRSRKTALGPSRSEFGCD